MGRKKEIVKTEGKVDLGKMVKKATAVRTPADKKKRKKKP